MKLNVKGYIYYTPGPWGTEVGVTPAQVDIIETHVIGGPQVIGSYATANDGSFSGQTSDWQRQITRRVWVVDDPGSVSPPRSPKGHWEDRSSADPSDVLLLTARVREVQTTGPKDTVLPFVYAGDGNTSPPLFVPWGPAHPGLVVGTIAYSERLLQQSEIDLARQVFQDTQPYGAIYISNGLGFSQRAYTIPHPLKDGSYVIHGGPFLFADATLAGSVSETFIHEMTHVWQGTHGHTRFDYVVNSLYFQAALREHAYDYTPGQSWHSYNAEQQAQIVEDWFGDGMSQSDARFRYIRDNIRAGVID